MYTEIDLKYFEIIKRFLFNKLSTATDVRLSVPKKVATRNMEIRTLATHYLIYLLLVPSHLPRLGKIFIHRTQNVSHRYDEGVLINRYGGPGRAGLEFAFWQCPYFQIVLSQFIPTTLASFQLLHDWFLVHSSHIHGGAAGHGWMRKFSGFNNRRVASTAWRVNEASGVTFRDKVLRFWVECCVKCVLHTWNRIFFLNLILYLDN